jgi:hypothetical protein
MHGDADQQADRFQGVSALLVYGHLAPVRLELRPGSGILTFLRW